MLVIEWRLNCPSAEGRDRREAFRRGDCGLDSALVSKEALMSYGVVFGKLGESRSWPVQC